MTVAKDRLNAFLGRAVGDMAASVSAVLVLIGDELGLYSALAGQRLSPCLLYTSPSPRDISGSRMPSSA